MGVSVLWNLLKTLRSPGPSIIEIHCWALSRDNFASITHCVHVWWQETQIEDSENCSNEDKRRKLQQARAKWGFWMILADGPTPAGAPHSPTHPPAGPRSWCKSEQNELISSSAAFLYTRIRFLPFSIVYQSLHCVCKCHSCCKSFQFSFYKTIEDDAYFSEVCFTFIYYVHIAAFYTKSKDYDRARSEKANIAQSNLRVKSLTSYDANRWKKLWVQGAVTLLKQLCSENNEDARLQIYFFFYN